MDYFGDLASPKSVNKTLIYGGDENQQRTKYKVLSWKHLFVFFVIYDILCSSLR